MCGFSKGKILAICLFFTQTLISLGQSYNVSTFAGSGQIGSVNGQGRFASFNRPTGIATDRRGNVYVADNANHVIRKITPLGLVSNLAGSGVAGYNDGVGNSTSFRNPSGLATDSAGNVYVADNNNHRIRKITPIGVVSTIAGSGIASFSDGQGTSASFRNPSNLVVDSDGNIFVSDFGNHRIRKITPNGLVTTVAGSGTAGFADGFANQAMFNGPNGLDIDSLNNLFVSDYFNHSIRKISSIGIVTTFAGSGSSGYTDQQGNFASFFNPADLKVDLQGNIIVADQNNNRIRKISPTGLVSTIAGSGVSGSQDGFGVSASFSIPSGVAIDSTGYIFIVDYRSNIIRKLIVCSTTIPVITGNNSFCENGSTILTSSATTGNLWSNGATSQSITVSLPGTYSVSVITSGCISLNSQPIVISRNPTPAIPFITASRTNLIGSDSSVLTVSNVVPNAIYEWTNGQLGRRIVVRNSDTIRVRAVINDCVSDYSNTIIITGTKKRLSSLDLKLFPNPSKGIVHLNSNLPAETVYITNSIGRVIYTSSAQEKMQLNLSNIAKGMYLIHVQTQNGTVISKPLILN